MNKVLISITLAVLITIVSAGVAPCPLQYQIGSIVSARVIVAQQQSLVPLSPNKDTQCYNYSLPYAFASIPEIAIGVHDFESRTSNDLFFSIKPLESESLGYVPFLIRTQWRYTYWTKIVFSFLAQDRKDLEAGYYQIDSGTLGGCEVGKSIQVLLPFRNAALRPGKINHNLFLHGFEISAQNYNDNTYSPFQLQIVQSNTNSTGISALISVTTVTQVHSLYISYIAWVSTNLNMIVGSYIYEFSFGSDISHTPYQNLGRNYARIYGLTGFIINHNYQSISFSTVWTGSKFNFNMGSSQKLTQYFTFQYIFFIGSECTDCPGYPYIYENKCYSSCPSGSFQTIDKICIVCGEGYFWNGERCVKLCPQGQLLNQTNNQCQCPEGLYWTGKICLACTSGRIFDPFTKSCKCPARTRWNGYACVQIPDCTNGKEWDIFAFVCKCPIGTIWNGTYCVQQKICKGGQILNSDNVCVCPDGLYLKDGWCQATGCTGGQIWDGGKCICKPEHNWNGTICLLCINGQIWNSAARKCDCPANFTWNGNFCERFRVCTNGRVYNPQYDACVCPEQQFWNGAICQTRPQCCCGKTWNETSFECNCPTGFNWDTKTCVLCVNGKFWNEAKKTCDCPPQTQWNGQFCAVTQKCFGGMIWNQNTWACECPSTMVWNGNYCITNPCRGGQVWDNSLGKCICVGRKVWINNFCQIPEIICTYGRIWDAIKLKCVCPQGKWDTGSECIDIPYCAPPLRYNPNNNQCQCPYNLVWLAAKNQCADPTCPYGKRWDGFGCVTIACPPGSFYNGTECICPELNKNCLPWEFFDGQKCVYFQDTCPKGTRWNMTHCVPINNCPLGYYGEDNQCKPLSQQCLPPTKWNSNRCEISGQSCPMGSYYRSGSCDPFSPCQNGQKWDRNVLQCLCPEGTGWNGNQCVVCGGGQVWDSYQGCTCPDGHFFAGATCEKADRGRCNNIPNSYWSAPQNLCLCEPGFVVSGYSCVCKGVPFNNFCDRCAFRPHSSWDHGICKCDTGYTLYGNECLPNLNNGTDSATDCGVATYFDPYQKKCLACPRGCLTCEDPYICQICNVDFIYDSSSKRCNEICGDGRRYTHQCDDNNTMNGDGCSSSCKIQDTYTCTGGSPSTSDVCRVYQPSTLDMQLTGLIRYSTRIIVNVKLDYLPKSLFQSVDCNDQCKSVVVAKVLSGSSPISIRSSYNPGSRYGFSIQIEFGKPFVGKFVLEVGINPIVVTKYYNPDSVSVTPKTYEINPAELARADKSDILS